MSDGDWWNALQWNGGHLHGSGGGGGLSGCKSCFLFLVH